MVFAMPDAVDAPRTEGKKKPSLLCFRRGILDQLGVRKQRHDCGQKVKMKSPKPTSAGKYSAGSSRPAAAASAGKPRKSAAKSSAPAKPRNKSAVVLLSGGNPQIAKAGGDAPVQAYIAAMPGWKSGLGTRLDALVVRHAPHVRKAVKWNSPFYGAEGRGWFLSFHVLTRYVKVTFFNGASLDPIPPGGTPKSGKARWIDIYEDDKLDEVQMARR
jgi:hypothetical protein